MNFLHFTAEGLVDVAWLLGEPALMFGQMGMFPPTETSRTGTPIEGAAGYQTLSADELSSSFTSGMEARNQAVFGDMIVLNVNIFMPKVG